MKHAAVALIPLALAAWGCGPEVDRACDRAALDAVADGGDAEALLAACPGMPDGVGRRLRGETVAEAELPPGIWECPPVPLERAQLGFAGAMEAAGACGLVTELDLHPGIGAAELASGAEPIGAALAGQWLRSAGYDRDQARAVARAVLSSSLSTEVPPVRLPTSGLGASPTSEVSAEVLLVEGDLRVGGEPVTVAEIAGKARKPVAVLAHAQAPSTEVAPLVAALADRGVRLDLLAVDAEGVPRAVPVTPVPDRLGFALAGAVEVHLFDEERVLVRHGTPIRTSELVADAELVPRVRALLAEDVPGRTLRLVPHGQPVVRLARLAHALSPLGTVHLAPGDRACPDTPIDGMACVEGALLDEGRRVGPFLVDTERISLATYRQCVEKGGCSRGTRGDTGPERVDDLSFEEALRFCVHQGKTLPTRWQWEAAQAAGVLQGADASPAEWTRTGHATRGCGEACTGVDPIGPCGGAPECSETAMLIPRTIVRHARTAMRSGEEPAARSVKDDVGTARCVAPWPAPEPVGTPKLEPLEPPDQRLLDLFHGSAEDDIAQKPLCDGVGGQAHLDCRDPVTYIIGNEPRAHLFKPFLEGLGGGYIGVAADQNYSQAAVAKTRWLWLMDYDPKVVSVHRMNGVFIRASETPAEFVDWYKPSRRVEAQAFVREKLGDDELTELALRNLRVWGDRLYDYYQLGMEPPQGKEGIDGKWVPPGDDDFGWLRNKAHYEHIRTLWTQGRVRAVKGDMLGPKGMQGIGRAAREMGVPIRVYYTSNAPYAWGGMMQPSYRRNVRSLPMDEHSILVQTLGSRSGFGQETYWHHSVVRGNVLQERLGEPGFDHVSKIVWDRAHGGDPDLTVLGVPAPE